MEYTDFSDRYVIKLCFLLPPNPDCPDVISPNGERQRIKALVTNLRAEDTLNSEKLDYIAGRVQVLHQWMRGAHFYGASDDLLDLKMIKVPYLASPGEHPVNEAWKAFTGSSCHAYKPISQATAFRPQIVLARKRPSMIPPAPLQVPWHPEQWEERNASLHPTTLYSAQVLASGQRIYTIFTPIRHAGGEEISGLWRVSAYNQDDTIYFSVVLKVTEERDTPKKPLIRKRMADDDGQFYDGAPSRKRQHIINE